MSRKFRNDLCIRRNWTKRRFPCKKRKRNFRPFVFISSSRNKLSNCFRKDLPQYRNGQTAMLSMSTCDTIEITKAALSVLKDIYREGVTYKKAGVILGNITSASAVQQNLFDDIKNRPQRFKLMKNIDDINHKFGIKKIHLAVEEGNKQSWRSKSEHRSGNYLSDINEILTINI